MDYENAWMNLKRTLNRMKDDDKIQIIQLKKILKDIEYANQV